MTPTHAAAVLRQLTDWRKGVDVDPPKPGEVLEAIDAAITVIERTQELETALREFTWCDDSESQADCTRAVLEKSK